MDLYDYRRQYESKGLSREDLAEKPIVQFEQWLSELLALDVPDPTAMVLATNDADQPSQRIVLLKKVDQSGFVFFTNRDSSKGRNISENAKIGLHFPWHFINRQVSVKGIAKKTSVEEDQAYFSSRPVESQWAAWASAQSTPISSREVLTQKYELIKERYPSEVPLAKFWGGYRVIPFEIEFWQGRENRLHDRFVYRKKDDDHWSIERLSP
ncbi:MAG: pyridoxamine 5'-phosphate oxidase [Cellvibrionaceae bacterium]